MCGVTQDSRIVKKWFRILWVSYSYMSKDALWLIYINKVINDMCQAMFILETNSDKFC